MSHDHHAINYVEINVDDLAASMEFYRAAFGWEFNEYGPSYAGIRSADREGEVGGLNATETPVPGGRRFHFSDPSGNVLGVWAEPVR